VGAVREVVSCAGRVLAELTSGLERGVAAADKISWESRGSNLGAALSRQEGALENAKLVVQKELLGGESQDASLPTGNDVKDAGAFQNAMVDYEVAMGKLKAIATRSSARDDGLPGSSIQAQPQNASNLAIDEVAKLEELREEAKHKNEEIFVLLQALQTIRARLE